MAALPLGHCLGCDAEPPCCLNPHLPLTKNPNCVYLSDCLLAGSGTDWLTVNLSSRCTAEGNRIFEPNFVDTLTIQNDQISHVKHVLAPLYVFFTLFGCCGGGWGLPRGLGRNLLMQLSRLSSSRMLVPLSSSRCLAEGNRISVGKKNATYAKKKKLRNLRQKKIKKRLTLISTIELRFPRAPLPGRPAYAQPLSPDGK